MSTTFDYTQMSVDQPTHQLLRTGCLQNEETFKSMRADVKSRMEAAGLLGFEDWTSTATTAVNVRNGILTDHRWNLEQPAIPRDWAEYAIKSLMFMTRYKFKRTNPYKKLKQERMTPQPGTHSQSFASPDSNIGNASSVASTTKTRGSKREPAEEEDVIAKRVKREPTFSEDSVYELEIERRDQSQPPQSFDVRIFMTKDVSGKWFADGFLTADYPKFLRILVTTNLLADDRSEHLLGWYPLHGKWQLIANSEVWQGNLTSQAKHNGDELLKFLVQATHQLGSQPAPPMPPQLNLAQGQKLRIEDSFFPQPRAQPGLQPPPTNEFDEQSEIAGLQRFPADKDVEQLPKVQPPPVEARVDVPNDPGVQRAPDRNVIGQATRTDEPQLTVEMDEDQPSGSGFEQPLFPPEAPVTKPASETLARRPRQPAENLEGNTQGRASNPVPIEDDSSEGSEAEAEPLPDEEEYDAGDDSEMDDDMELLMDQVKNNLYCAHFDWEEIKNACGMYQHSIKKLNARDMVKIPGTKGEGLHVFQMFAVYLILTISSGDANGLLLADEMGLGKTIIILAWFVTQRWLALMWDDVQTARESNDKNRHVPEGTKENPQPKGVQCPSQSKWPLLCPCVDRHCTSKFRPVTGLTIGIIPPRLILNWGAEWDTFIDEEHRKLKLKCRILHSSAPQEKVLSSNEAEALWIDPVNDQWPSLDASSYLFLTTAPSWSRVQKLFTKTWEVEVMVPKRKTPKKEKRSSWQLLVGAQFIDEVHETRGQGTVAMNLMCRFAKANPECTSLFASGTPWTSSPRELAGILGVMEPSQHEVEAGIRDWSDHPQLRMAMAKPFEDVCKLYETLANKDEDMSKNQAALDNTATVAGILEAIMVRRTSETAWFDGPIVEVPRNVIEDREVNFPGEYKPYMAKLNEVVDQQLRRETQVWEKDHPGQKKKGNLGRWFSVSYKQRACATIPGLAKLLVENPTLKVTWEQYVKEGWLRSDDDPYLQELPELMRNCPKLEEIKKEINCLGKMNKRVFDDDGNKVMVEDGQGVKKQATVQVDEKLVIVGHNPIVCGIIAKALQQLYPNHNVEWMHGKHKNQERQKMVHEFQEKPGFVVPNAPTILVGAFGILGTGHTLHRAKKIIITDPEFKATKEEQAIFRISRIGTINETKAVILECVDVDVEKTIKDRQRRHAKHRKGTIRSRAKVIKSGEEENKKALELAERAEADASV